MSFGSFFEKIGSEFEKLFKKTPTWAQTAQGIMLVVAPLALTILSLVDPEAEPLAAAIISRIQASMAVIKAVATHATAADGATAMQSVETAINAINSDMADLLTAAQVKNPQTAAKITAAANTITTELTMLLNAMPTSAPAAA